MVLLPVQFGRNPSAHLHYRSQGRGASFTIKRPALFLPRNDTDQPLTSIEELVEAFRGWGKPRDCWLTGTEYEMIGVNVHDPDRPAIPPYEGEFGIGAMFRALAERGWEAIRDGDSIIALSKNNAQITCEPGGQFEHAMRPVRTARAMERDAREYIDELTEPSRACSLVWLAVGFRPFGRLEDGHWMPKARYDIMREYLRSKGLLANEMMQRTATVQCNLDYDDPDDAKAKFRCMMSVTSLLTAIYANSSIVDGKVSDYQSYRTLTWTDMDQDRCGILPFAFDDGDVFRNYVEWALDVPIPFIYRDGVHLRTGGRTFRRFLLEGFEGHRATIDDWELHLSILFPEVRIKRFIEVRGCDAGSFGMNMALAPLCRGLMYDKTACREATKLTAGLSFDERIELWHAVARQGLRAKLPRLGHRVLDLARELVAIADDGLSRHAPDDRYYLAPVRQVVESGRTQADALADMWKRTGGAPRPLIEALAYPGLGLA